MRQPGLAAAFLVLSVLWPCAASLAEDGVTRQSIAGNSGLATWETDNSGVHFRLTQISPDQARAFMLGRGLDPKAADEFARTCVYMTVLRNDGRQPIKYCMVDWRYIPEDGIEQLMLTKHDWLARWKPRNFAKPVKKIYEEMADKEALPVRIYILEYVDSLQKARRMTALHHHFHHPRCTFGGWKLAIDGGGAAGTALMYDKTLVGSRRAFPLHKPEELNRIVEILHGSGLQISIHVVGDE